MQRDVEVADATDGAGPIVSQAFCSALPAAYTDVPARRWQAFATLVLEAAYVPMMWAAVRNAARGVSDIPLLTLLGGGAFGNEEQWNVGSMRRALEAVSSFHLSVKIVSYAAPTAAILEVTEAFR